MCAKCQKQTSRRFRKRHPSCRRALALIVPSLAAGACSFRPGVKLVWLAETAISAERCAALFDSEEPTVSPARSSVGSAPFIGVGGGRTGDKEQRYREPSSNSEAFEHDVPPTCGCLVRHNTDAHVLVPNVIATTSPPWMRAQESFVREHDLPDECVEQPCLT